MRQRSFRQSNVNFSFVVFQDCAPNCYCSSADRFTIGDRWWKGSVKGTKWPWRAMKTGTVLLMLSEWPYSHCLYYSSIENRNFIIIEQRLGCSWHCRMKNKIIQKSQIFLRQEPGRRYMHCLCHNFRKKVPFIFSSLATLLCFHISEYLLLLIETEAIDTKLWVISVHFIIFFKNDRMLNHRKHGNFLFWVINFTMLWLSRLLFLLKYRMLTIIMSYSIKSLWGNFKGLTDRIFKD
jgi:hypothetical protein